MGKEINYLERRKKSGFFFSLDSFMGLILFILTLALVYSFFIGSHSLEQEFFISEDFLNIFTNVKVSDIDTSRYSVIENQINTNVIKDTNLLLVEEVSILYNQNPQDSKDFINNLVYEDIVTKKGLIPIQYDIDLLFNKLSLYPEKNADTSSAVITRQRLVSIPLTTTTTTTT